MQRRNTRWLAGLLALSMTMPVDAYAEPVGGPLFDLVPLGVEGGVVEGATTAWFVAPHGAGPGLTCDAGSLVPGIRAAIRKGGFPRGTRASDILQKRIRIPNYYKAYIVLRATVKNRLRLIG